MFKKGAFILYGAVGVCQIERISETDFSDNDKLYYYLVPRYEKETTIYIPVNSDKVRMREIMTRQQAEHFISAWPSIECKSYASDRERTQVYKEVLQSGDCLELASMIKEISRMEQSRRGNGKMLSIRERDGVKCARKLLFGELAAALNIHPEEVQDYIQDQTGCIS